MSLSLATHVLDGMGFRQVTDGEELAATFHSVHVYEVRGITLEDGVVLQTRATTSGVAYTVAAGKSVNEVCRALVGDELTTDEDAWSKEHRCKPPYVVLHFGPTALHQSEGRHVKAEGSLLVTYDSFAAAKLELRSLEDRALPSLVTSLACSFGSLENEVKLKPVDREAFGLTPDGRFLQDIRFQLSASAYVSRKLAPEAPQAALDTASSLTARINPKVSRFFHLAMEEEDRLKRFLYFFLAIEIETHAAFLSIDHSAHIERIVISEDRIRSSSTGFFEAQRERWTNLKDRFIWCAMCAWTHVTDSDVVEFSRLKKVRDDIAHGSLSEPPPDAVNSAEKLALKLLRPLA